MELVINMCWLVSCHLSPRADMTAELAPGRTGTYTSSWSLELPPWSSATWLFQIIWQRSQLRRVGDTGLYPGTKKPKYRAGKSDLWWLKEWMCKGENRSQQHTLLSKHSLPTLSRNVGVIILLHLYFSTCSSRQRTLVTWLYRRSIVYGTVLL